MKQALPWISLAVTILIWAGYLVAVRAAAATTLTPNDVGILRSVPTALILLPFTLKRGLFPGGARWPDILLIGAVGGGAFTFLLNNGAHYAPVADSAIFAPSTLPLNTMILALIFLGVRAHALQYIGIGIILFGAIAVGGYEALTNAGSETWKGHVMFYSASLCWAIYTVRFRASQLSALNGTLILATWSGFLFLGNALISGSNLLEQPTSVFVVQLALGISAGLVANFSFLYAIQRLGTVIPAASAALVPVIAALGGWIFLAEPIGILKAAGISIVALGVLLASGLFSKPVTQN